MRRAGPTPLRHATTPFVLIDDARVAACVPARLYRDPVAIVAAHSPGEIEGLLETLARARRDGLHAAGYFAYEAGAAFEPRVAFIADRPGAGRAAPLAWFGLFEGVERIAPADVAALLEDPAGAWIGAPDPHIGARDYVAQVERILEYIRAGDIYQANLTFQCDVPVAGHPLAVYAALRARAQAGHGGIVRSGDDWQLSLSPELFFALADGIVTARPMKGTATRGADREADARQAAELAADPKQRAENLMIVDLMRNDLSRVSRPGSVAVPQLFHVETYPTVHQLVSSVTGEIEADKDVYDVIRAAFPCGSITGAPKIRAMEIIAACEGRARGIYTGSIGHIAPDGSAAFNVAIRTLRLADTGLPGHQKNATLGLGAGIVADSDPAREWQECLAKGRFVGDGKATFDLVETMAFDPLEGLVRLERHLARMKASAEAFGFAFDRHQARNELQAATFRLTRPSRLRLMIAQGGAIAIEIRDMPRLPAMPVVVAPVARSVSADDFRLRHKTTDRGFYDDARAASRCWEAILIDDAGFVTEGSFTNVFVDRGGQLLTPPLDKGLLPGVLRAELIEQGRAIESPIRLADLEATFYLGNSLRGLIPARLADS